MIQIDKHEAEMVRKKFPFVHIHKTVHKYYVEEAPRIMRFLRRGQPQKEVIPYRRYAY